MQNPKRRESYKNTDEMSTTMKKASLVLMVLLSMLIFGCKSMTFEEGAAKIAEINAKTGATMESYPADEALISSMIGEFRELEKSRVSEKKEQFSLILRYRILTLESGIPLLKAASYGNVGVTGDGFSCKPKPIIMEAAALRNKSAQKSFEAVTLLTELVEKYPSDAKVFGLSSKTVIFQNATAYQVWDQGAKDARTIGRFCSDERVLELYKQEFREKKIMSEEEISALTYDLAAKKWREIRGK
jgi:hypothetical protein